VLLSTGIATLPNRNHIVFSFEKFITLIKLMGLCSILLYICKTQIRVLPSNACPIITSYSDPCPSLKCLSNHYVILRSMSFISLVPSNLCPLMSHPDLCPFKNISPQICAVYRHTRIYFLHNICSLRSMSSDIIHRSR
jgi:hypothetical protein